MPSVEIVAIGTEILLGDLVDTNSPHIASSLAKHGLDVYAKHAVGDNAARIAAMLRGVLDRSDGAVVTGGLGPTVDDLTREAVADAVGAPLELHEPSLRAIEARFAAMGRTMSDNNRRQALLPRGALVLPNPNGTAPGFIASRADGKLVGAMPGVPAEMKPMLADQVLPWLIDRFGLRGGIVTRTLHTIGLPESEVDSRIHDLFASLENPKIAVLAHLGRVDVRIMAKAPGGEEAQALIAPVERELRGRLEPGVYGADDETLEGALVTLLAQRGLTLAVAESVTGGAVADALVGVPGASACFLGGIVAYDNGAKVNLLDVAPDTLARHGAVSEEVAREMARGVRARFGAQIAVATTGIAGPGGASPEKPVGLVWFAVATPDGERARRIVFPGDRTAVRRRAAATAVDLTWRIVSAQETTASRRT